MRRKKVETPPAPGQQAGMKKVRTTEEYLAPIEEKTAPIDIPAREIIEDDEPLDKIGEFFNRIEVEQGWRIVVWRLPSFNRDGRSDSRADKVYLGNIPLDPDHYLETTQEMWGEGTYKFESKDPDSKFGPKWVEHIGSKPVPGASNRASGVHYIMQPNGNGTPVEAPPVRDTLQELLDAGEKAQKLKKVFGWEQEAPAREAIPVAATVEREPLQDRIIGAALESVFKSGKPETAEEILRAYIAPQREEGWAELIKELMKPLAPIVMNIIAAYMQGQAARAQAQGQAATVAPLVQPQLPPQAEPNPSPYAPQFPPLEIPQNAEPYDTFQQGIGQTAPLPPGSFIGGQELLSEEDEEENMRDDLVYSLGEMLEQCVRKAASDPETIELGRQEVMAYKRRFPMLTGFIDALTTLPPEAIIGMLAMKMPEVAAMINNDVARQTILDFQKALRRPEVIQ